MVGLLLTSFGKGWFAVSQYLIGLSPVALLTGIYVMINFGWFVMINTLLTVFLQNPLEGGYAFTPQQNAACTFRTVLVGILQLIPTSHILPVGRPYRCGACIL